MRPDTIERFGNSVVQHGPVNDRVYLMKLDRNDMPGIIDRIEALGRRHGYTKLFARVPGHAAVEFEAQGFTREAFVPGMFRGRSNGCFMSKYREKGRAETENGRQIEKILELTENVLVQKAGKPSPGRVVKLGPTDCESLANLYASVFDSYPFPIFDPDWLAKAMGSDVIFFGIHDDRGRLAAAASAELDRSWRCAEMTDFATRPKWRGKGAAGALLTRMEMDAREEEVLTAYTIARAQSPGMNIVFARAGYEHGGTLLNNTQIGGSLESMNVWYKSLIGPVSPA
ncbi:MAG: putative beta-lysine N-acetyltransferase [Deltaproteobacteria bacterium]|nr:putative beta-lysine N-acetyltransferase [Deltaproteobacteria bacterium]